MNILKFNRKNICTFAFFACSILFHAQSQRFYYGVNFKLDSAGSVERKDVTVLEINKNSNIFMSNEYIVTDSLNSINRDNMDFAYPKFKEIVEYEKKEDQFTFIENLSMNYYQFSAKKKINWTILNEKKKIGNFEVIKAKAKYGGRNWEAWFCPEIALPYGPYVFYGLPGLILEVYDDKANYHFTFIQNKNYNSNLDSSEIIKKLFSDRKTNIQEKDWPKIQLNYYNNPIAEYKSGNAYMTKDDGTKYTANDYRNLEIAIQKNIRTFNNPIELENIVQYPLK